MFVGIVCACIPSAAKSCNHHIHCVGALKSYIGSRVLKLNSQAFGASHSPHSSPFPTDRAAGYLKYSTIENIYLGSRNGDKAQNRGTKTFVEAGKQHEVEHDGIRLTFEMQNEYS